MSLISEYLQKISKKRHSSEQTVNIPPMLFDSNQENLKKKKVKKIVLLGVTLLLVVSVTGLFLKPSPPAKEIKKELIPVRKPVIKQESIKPKSKQETKLQSLQVDIQDLKTQDPKTQEAQKSIKVDQLTINIGNVDKINSVEAEEKIVNDQEDTGFQKKQNKAGYKLYFNLGLNAQQNKDYSKAEEYYKKSLNIKSDYEKSLINLSTIYVNMEAYNKAVDLLEDLYELDPDNIKASVNLGIAYLKQKNYKKAEKFLLEAVEKDQNNIISLYNLAVLYQTTDQFDKAVELYAKIVKIDPDNYKSLLACSSIYEKREEYLKAIDNYKKCLQTTKVSQSNKLRNIIINRIKLIQAIIAANA
ncbi:MAG: tetratricopeptide repeat protein [Desulfobacteraceae bacterium]|nr:tetratricopeptide repeat protein [Desulfobacteraceae bacterium]